MFQRAKCRDLDPFMLFHTTLACIAYVVIFLLFLPVLVLNSMKRFSQRVTQQSVDAVVLVQQLINISTLARELRVSTVCELTLRVSALNFTQNKLHV